MPDFADHPPSPLRPLSVQFVAPVRRPHRNLPALCAADSAYACMVEVLAQSA